MTRSPTRARSHRIGDRRSRDVVLTSACPCPAATGRGVGRPVSDSGRPDTRRPPRRLRAAGRSSPHPATRSRPRARPGPPAPVRRRGRHTTSRGWCGERDRRAPRPTGRCTAASAGSRPRRWPSRARAPLRPRQERHDHHTGRDQHGAHRRTVRLRRPGQAPQCLDGHVEGEGEERARDDPQGSVLAAGRIVAGELPRHGSGRADLDDRVRSEPDQGDRGRGTTCGDGGHGLDDVVADGDRDEPADEADQDCATVVGEGRGHDACSPVCPGRAPVSGPSSVTGGVPPPPGHPRGPRRPRARPPRRRRRRPAGSGSA